MTCPRWCPRYAPRCPRWYPRHAPDDVPDDAPDMPQMMPQTCPRYLSNHPTKSQNCPILKFCGGDWTNIDSTHWLGRSSGTFRFPGGSLQAFCERCSVHITPPELLPLFLRSRNISVLTWASSHAMLLDWNNEELTEKRIFEQSYKDKDLRGLFEDDLSWRNRSDVVFLSDPPPLHLANR